MKYNHIKGKHKVCEISEDYTEIIIKKKDDCFRITAVDPNVKLQCEPVNGKEKS